MNKVLDFFKAHKYAIIWTMCYILIMWCILKWLFNFDMFVMRNWVILAHAKLRGFPGFVFGILILAAIPMYVATTSIIIRTKKPLITPKIPKFMQPVLDENVTPKEDDEKEIEETEESIIKEEPQKILPTELRHAFIRARAHIGPAPKSNFDIGNMSNKAAPQPQTPSEQGQNDLASEDFPIPDDFSESMFDSDTPSFVPVFSDINFDDDTTEEEKQPRQEIDDLLPIKEYLKSQNKEFSIEDGIIVTTQDVIAAHNDPDFWVADNEAWFASGKLEPSPVEKVLTIGTERGLRPILYLGQTNILDLESRISEWSEKGVMVITNLDELK